MSKSLVEIEGFDQLRQQISKLGKDSLKRREMLKILRQSAKATVRAAKREAPVSAAPHLVSGRRTRKVIQPGNLKKSIGNITGRSKTIPTIYVGARAKRNHDGWYAHFVHGGTRSGIQPNPFMDRAYNQTKGQVTPDLEQKVARYVQKQINKLSNAT